MSSFRTLSRTLAVWVAVLFVVGSVAGCTCNKAGTSRKAKPKSHEMARGKIHKAKMRRGTKTKRGGNVPRVETSLFFIDQAKFDQGAEDYWVEVKRSVGAKAPAKNAVWNLFKGPTPEEQAKGLTFMASGAVGFQGFAIEGDTATLQLRGGCNSNGATVTVYDHLKKTLSQFPEIQHVRVVGPDDSVPTEPGDHRPACLEP